MDKFYNSQGEEIQILRELGKGGEGIVFLTNNQNVMKIYKSQTLIEEKKNKIELFASKKLIYNGICLPSEIVLNNMGKFVGYIMPKAEGYEMQTCIFQPNLLKLKFPSWTRINLANLCLTILDKINFLHKNEIILGDINPFNILIKSDTEVYFVDTDSYQIGNYPCPVGTSNFTPPEIQNKDYKSFLRTKEHEYFAVATLLFMTFLPGKAPYSFQGGGDPTENIRNMNFSYPLGDEDNYLAPQGMWEFIWVELPFEVRKAFYTVFKENYRLSIEDWLAVIENYKIDLLGRNCPIEIIPTDTQKILTGRTLNMNRRDIKKTDTHLRNNKTVLKPNIKEETFAVLELSTKAVKLLIGNKNELLKNGFNFDSFPIRESDKTETGRGLDTENNMDMEYYRKSVLPSIRKMLHVAKERKVDVLYTVATAAYRTANNRDEIIETIKNECSINVKILSKKEEALATLTAFLFSRPAHLKIEPKQDLLMIDQGGGSTEISLFRGNGELLDSYSLNLGSMVLKTILFKEATAQTPMDKAFKDSEKLIKDRLRTFYSNPKSKLLNKNKSNFCISVGTAITSATNKKGNRNQHGTAISLMKLKEKIYQIDALLKSKFSNILELLHALEDKTTHETSKIDNLVVMRVGLPMYVEIMQNFNINEVIVSGTGLWYGIYFEKLYNINTENI